MVDLSKSHYNYYHYYYYYIIININQINYLLHLLLITLRWGRPVPFTLQLGLQAGLTLKQYSKGSDTH